MNFLEAVKEVIEVMEKDSIYFQDYSSCFVHHQHHLRLLKMMVRMVETPVPPQPNTVTIQGSTAAVLYPDMAPPPPVQPMPNTALHNGRDPWDEAQRRNAFPLPGHLKEEGK